MFLKYADNETKDGHHFPSSSEVPLYSCNDFFADFAYFFIFKSYILAPKK